MQQRFRRFTVFFGAASLAAGGLVMVACGTDNGESVATPQVEAGKDTGAGKETGTDPDTDGGPLVDGGDAPDCSNEPKLRAVTADAGFFCGFYRNDAGTSSNCASDETCCNPSKVSPNDAKFPLSFCAPGKGADKCITEDVNHGSTFTPDAGTAWECADKSACGAGQICCLIQDEARLAVDPAKNKLNIGSFGKNNPDHPVACNGKAAYNAGGSRCTTGACGAAEYTLCSLTDTTSCPNGTKCVAIEASFRDLGYCAPTN